MGQIFTHRGKFTPRGKLNAYKRGFSSLSGHQYSATRIETADGGVRRGRWGGGWGDGGGVVQVIDALELE